MAKKTAAETIRKDLNKAQPVEENTILAWTSVHPVNGAEFHYAAVFAGGVWYTTVGRDNQNVQKIMQHDELMEYLVVKGSNLKNIRVAIEFEEV